MQKALIYSNTRSYTEAAQTYLRALELEASNKDAILNLAEAYILNKQNQSSDEHIEKYKSYFDGPNGNQAKKLFSVLKAYNNDDNTQLIIDIKNQIDSSNLIEKKERFDSWGLAESLDYIEHNEDSITKKNVKHYYDYLLGKISGTELSESLITA